MGGKWKESKKWFSSEFYSIIFNTENLNLKSNVVRDLLYLSLFILGWNRCSDISLLSIGHLIEWRNVKQVFSYLSIFISLSMSNNEIFNKKVVAKRHSLLEVLPLKKEICIKGRLIYILTISIAPIVCYIAMYVIKSNSILLGLRGINSIIILMFLLSCSIFNIVYFTRSKLLIRIVRIINRSFIVIAIAILLTLNEKISILFDKFIMNIILSGFMRFIGNFYVGAIIGIISLVAFYYFNYKYILNGIQEKRWGI